MNIKGPRIEMAKSFIEGAFVQWTIGRNMHLPFLDLQYRSASGASGGDKHLQMARAAMVVDFET